MGYITPENAPDSNLFKKLRIPRVDGDNVSTQIIYGAIKGALLVLTREQSWEQVGSITPAEMADVMQSVVDDFLAEPFTTS